MPLTPPKLDDRTFKELFEQARARIPAYLPEWTNFNESDPGITLLQLQAWLTETILYRLNQLPDLNYLKFLQLLGIQQTPAQPARADVTFVLSEKKLPGQAHIFIPKGTLLRVASPDLPEPVYFETDQTLTAINATLAKIYTFLGADANEVTPDSGTFQPFGDDPNFADDEHPALLLGFASKVPLTREEFGLQIYLKDEPLAPLEVRAPDECGSEAPAPDAVQWQWYDGSSWSNVSVTSDETESFRRSGRVYLKIPGQIPARSEAELDLIPPPAAGDPPPLLFYWLRAVLNEWIYDAPPEVDRILTNTVTATAAQTVADEVVGSSDGMPNQGMLLRHAPILTDPPLVLEIDEGEGAVVWREVTDFSGSNAASTDYVLNHATGEIRFGDNTYGRIPRAGQANVIARGYRYGGGRAGNVGANTITDLVRRINGVESVFNQRAAAGGADEEPIAATMVRVPRELRANDRAVTLQDFGELAKKTPGAQIARAYAYVDHSLQPLNKLGCISTIRVVIVPRTEAVRPAPSEVARRMVCRYLDERRLITTAVTVQAPVYHDVVIQIKAKIRDDADKPTVRASIDDLLHRYLDPLAGGADGLGWEFGRDLYYSELMRELMAVPGVLRVDSLKLLKGIETFTDPATMQSDAAARANELSGQQPAPGETGCAPSYAALRIDPAPAPKDVAGVWYAVLAVYDCCDLPVDEGALIALVRTDIDLDYERRQP